MFKKRVSFATSHIESAGESYDFSEVFLLLLTGNWTDDLAAVGYRYKIN